MDEQFIRDRITQLRMQKGVSEYRMSLELGRSRSYVQSIVSGRALPSMSEFLYICEYLGTTPRDFFDRALVQPPLVQKATQALRSLPEQDLLLLLRIIQRLREGRE